MIAKKYTDFNVLIATFDTYLTANATRLGIVAELVTEVNNAKTAWDTAFATYENRATRTPVAIDNIKGMNDYNICVN